jgi:hypothetical protein
MFSKDLADKVDRIHFHITKEERDNNMNDFKGNSKRVRAGTALGLLLGLGGNVHAGKFDMPDADVVVRWDNTVRYNVGVRTEQQDKRIVNNPSFDASDLKFDKGDLVTNRLDLLTEFDLVFKKAHGFRVSAAGWYDNAYRDTAVKGNPAFGPTSAYPGNQYTNYARRYNRGPSGEILDAFVFTRFDLGAIPVNVKAGRHSLYWGESLFSLANSIAYSQAPVDVLRAVANPGSQAKELFLPLSQLSLQAQVSTTLSVAAQYSLDWEPWRLPDGGTYFGSANFFSVGGGTHLPNGIPFNGASVRPEKRGDRGAMARWSPDWLSGTVGLYYREFGEKLPWLVFSPGFADAHLAYAGKTKLYGISATKEFGGTSFGAELSYRKNTALNSNAVATEQGARGDTWHALVNAITYFGKSPVWDAAPLTAELNYTRLDKVTSNEAIFPRLGSAACGSPVAGVPGDVTDGCATKDAWALNLALEPVFYQVLPGIDLKTPLSYAIGLKGNGPALGSSRKGNGSFSVGLSADVYNKYFISLKYSDYLLKSRDNGNAVTANNAAGAMYSDRGWVSLTVKTTF